MIPVNLTAITRRGDKGELTWRLSDGTTTGGPKDYPLVRCEQPDAYAFTVTINDAAGFNVKFAPQPLRVEEGGGCPVREGINTQQIVKVVRQSDSVLTFTNMNTDGPKDLRYQFDFVDAAGNPVKSLDPEIKNKGINPGVQSRTAVVIAVALIGILALAFVFRHKIF